MICVATFYTHAAALLTHRTLTANGIAAKMMPVPRAISSSCGTCVRYEADTPCYEWLDRDVEQVAEQTADGYRILKSFE